MKENSGCLKSAKLFRIACFLNAMRQHISAVDQLQIFGTILDWRNVDWQGVKLSRKYLTSRFLRINFLKSDSLLDLTESDLSAVVWPLRARWLSASGGGDEQASEREYAASSTTLRSHYFSPRMHPAVKNKVTKVFNCPWESHPHFDDRALSVTYGLRQ